eukprot:XP_022259008.1 uncharacterized protein LOC111090036 isoform X7 [Canis lupus familiaris]
MARKKEKIHGSKRKDQSKVKRKDLSFWLLLKLNFSYPCSTAIQEADDHPSHVFQKKEKILLEKTMPSLRTLSTQGQAQQGQRTFRQEIIPSVTRPVSWSTAHNWQEDNRIGERRWETYPLMAQQRQRNWGCTRMITILKWLLASPICKTEKGGRKKMNW